MQATADRDVLWAKHQPTLIARLERWQRRDRGQVDDDVTSAALCFAWERFNGSEPPRKPFDVGLGIVTLVSDWQHHAARCCRFGWERARRGDTWVSTRSKGQVVGLTAA